MAPPDVWHAEDPVLRPSGGPEIDVTVATRPCARGYEWFCEQPRSDREVAHRVRSSISRLSKHLVAPPDVWHAKDPVFRPSGGPEIDVTVATRPCGLRSRLRVVL